MNLPPFFTHALSLAAPLLLLSSPLAEGQLLLTEIQSNQNAAGKNDYWELTNFGAAPVDLSGWSWHDSGRNHAAAVAGALPAGTSIAPGESVLFTAMDAGEFRDWWDLEAGVQVFSWPGAPGLGQNDGVSLFDLVGNEVFFFSYAANGFTRANGSPSSGGHAGPSAGGSQVYQALIWQPSSGLATPRYTFADGSGNGTFLAAEGLDVGSPGFAGTPPLESGVVLALVVSPAAFSESAVNPAATGTVTRSGLTNDALVVSLSSNDTTEATVPATVTILPGQSSVTFPVSAVDDSFPDGDQTVTLTASAPGATAGTFQVTVQDDGDVFSARLLVTEIQSNQSPTASGRPSGTGDYWELTNLGAEVVSLEGWRWHDEGRNFTAAAGSALPAGASIAPGESVIFTSTPAELFRQWWGLPATVQVFPWAGAPGLGQNDGISLFEPGGNLVFFFSYAAEAFTLSDGNPSFGGHAGPSADGTQTYEALIWDPTSGWENPRYTYADGSRFGSFQAAQGADLGSPGRTDAPSGGAVVLTLEIDPAAFSESAAFPAATATVSRSGSTDQALEVTLFSSDPTEATVPASVLIPAGQASVEFPVTAVDDNYPDDDQTVTITATAAGAISASFEVTVMDDGDEFSARLLVTEIQSAQSSTASGRPAGAGDYWELTNFGDEPVSLEGWRWDDSRRSFSAAAGSALPAGAVIAPGESVIFTVTEPGLFRSWWALPSHVQVFQWSGAPGLGTNDAIALFEAGGNEVLYLSYAAGDLLLSDGESSLGGHAGPSAGAEFAHQALIWDPDSSFEDPRYTFASGENHGSFRAALGEDLGSPGRTRPGTATAFQQWLAGFGIAPSSPGSGPMEDADHDGVANLVEFALGGHPAHAGQRGVLAAVPAAAAGQEPLVLTFAMRQSNPPAVFSGSPSPTAQVDGIRYTVEGSHDLTGWTAAVEEITPPRQPANPLAAPAGYELRSFRLANPTAKGFLRIKVDELP